MKTRFVVIPIALGIISSGALAQIVSNGSFEVPIVPEEGGTYTNGQSFGGWAVDAGSAYLYRVSLSVPSPGYGLQSLFLSSSDTVIHQDLKTMVGAEYTVSFAGTCAVNDSGCDAVGHGVHVSWDAESCLDFFGEWRHVSHTFVATQTNTRLMFLSYKGVSLDDVSVVPIAYPLAIRKLDDLHVIVSWPTNATGYVLEYTTALPALTWITLTNTAVDRDNVVVTLDTPSTQQFFQLHRK